MGQFDVDLVREFFQGLVNHAGMTLHIDNLRGVNAHHQAETVFKAFGRALRMAATPDPRMAGAMPSTKGTLVTIAVVDYGMGNLRPCRRPSNMLAASQSWSPPIRTVSGAERVVFPGQGRCRLHAGTDARACGEAVLQAARDKPFGICIGADAFRHSSEEGDVEARSFPGTSPPFS